MKRRWADAFLVFAFLALSSIATRAHAQGYGLYEQSVCMMGRSGAGVAAPCDDGSGIFFNPAGLAADGKGVASIGVTGVAPRGIFTNSTTSLVSTLKDRTFPVPAGYVAAPIGKRTVVGFGVFAPYGLTTDWPATSEGRFLGYFSTIKAIYMQPTIAFKLNNQVSFGVGVAITRTSLELRKRVDLSTTPITGTPLTFGAIGVPRGTDFADVDLTGDGWKAGAHVGVLIKANDQLSFGARYLMKQTVDVNNGQVATTQVPTGLTTRVPLPGVPAGTPLDLLVKGAFATGGTLSNQTATTSLPMPDQFVAGIAVNATKHFKVMADYQYVRWSALDNITIANQYAPTTVLVETYGDTSGIRLGAEYGMGRGVFRVGFDAHGAAAPDQTVTPLLPEATRKEVSVGAGLPLGKTARIDVAYLYVNQSDRAGRSTDGGLRAPTAAVNNGTYHYYANLFSAGLVFHF